MSRALGFAVVIAALTGGVLLPTPAHGQDPGDPDSARKPAWLTDFAVAQREATRTGRPLFVYAFDSV